MLPKSSLVTRRELVLCAILVAITWAVYARVWNFELVTYDDGAYVNSQVKNGLTADGVRWAFVGYHDSNWIPLVWLSMMLNTSLFGSTPGSYHLVNVVLHTANVLLVFATLTIGTRNVWRSAFVAALFTVHPLHVESVAWISERKDVLSMFFGLLSLGAYVLYAQARRARYFVAAFVFFICSLLSKQTFVTLPFLLLLLDFWPLERLTSKPDLQQTRKREKRAADRIGESERAIRLDWRLLLEKVPFFVVSAAFCVVALFAQSSAGAYESLPLKTRCLNAVVVYLGYIEKAVVPINLSGFYPHPRDHLSLTLAGVSFAVLAAVTVFAAVNWRRRPYLLVGWLWYLGTLVPMIGLVQVGGQQMADRYSYLPLLGLYIMVAWLVPSLVPARLASWHIVPTLGTGVVLVYAAVAWVQVGHWRDSTALYQHMLVATDGNYMAHYLLGNEYLKQNRLNDALGQFREAVQIEPRSGRAHYYLGVALQTDRHLDEAAREYQVSLSLNERFHLAHLNLGAILLSRRQYADAKREFERAAQLENDDGRAVANLAAVAMEVGDYSQAVVYARRALQIDGSLSMCHRMLAVALQKQGRVDEAIEECRRLLASSPKDAQARSLLEQLLASQRGAGRFRN
ncbi:MAG TPA: tetratricopeptide repeat protein [Planctomycetaceae bacterium]|jgi:Tfp pilus assembly protein PilF|nr:tetratricopeptide repeat protein [Planctomycetaceae bacterium]